MPTANLMVRMLVDFGGILESPVADGLSRNLEGSEVVGVIMVGGIVGVEDLDVTIELVGDTVGSEVAAASVGDVIGDPTVSDTECTAVGAEDDGSSNKKIPAQLLRFFTARVFFSLEKKGFTFKFHFILRIQTLKKPPTWIKKRSAGARVCFRDLIGL